MPQTSQERVYMYQGMALVAIVFILCIPLRVFGATTIMYSQAGSGGSVIADGSITSGYGASMTIAHNTGNGDGASPVGTPIYVRALHNGSGTYLGRFSFCFDTSIVGTNTVSSATLSLFGVSTGFVNQSATSLTITGFTPANTNTLATTDFGNYAYTPLASTVAFSTLSQSAYNDFLLNTAGLTYINKTGITCFGGMTELDRTITTISNQDNIFGIQSADGANAPKLSITYAASSPLTSSATSTEAMLGGISFELAIITTLLFLMVVGFMYNNMKRKKPWH